MIKNEDNLNNKGPWWKPAMQIFSEVSTWIAVPIILALIVGKALDKHYGTKPIIFLCFAGLGFLITCFGMFRSIKNYVRKIQPPKSPSLDKGRIEEGLNQELK